MINNNKLIWEIKYKTLFVEKDNNKSLNVKTKEIKNIDKYSTLFFILLAAKNFSELKIRTRK